MLTFSNPGELDPRLITTFGVSIKESASPIGYFGTGLKYALATLLRTGHRVTLHIGDQKFTFTAEPESIRGTTIQMAVMLEHTPAGTVRHKLPFSLDLGRNWEVWMAYRELRSNAQDEGGSVAFGAPAPAAGHTHISVAGSAIEDCHANQHRYFISGKPIFATDECEVYARNGEDIFYRGVKVGSHPVPGLFTYNMLGQVKLTEDRTIEPIDGIFAVKRAIERAWLACPDEGALEDILLAKKRVSFEGGIDFSIWNLPSVVDQAALPFVRVAKRLAASKLGSLNPSAYSIAKQLTPAEKVRPTVVALTAIEVLQIARARDFVCRHFGLPADITVSVAESLGDGVLGLAHENEIWVSRMALSQGTKMLAGTIFEEWVHNTHNLRDCTRGMQNFLIDRLMSAGEANDGEPL